MVAGGTLLFVNPLFFLIPSTLLYFTRKTFPKLQAIYFFPLFWAAYEYIYMLTELSFPWLTLGNGLAKYTTFIQIADVIGAVGLSVVLIYLNILLYKAISHFKLLKKKFAYNLSAAFIIFILILGYGFYRLSTFQVANLATPKGTSGQAGKSIKVGLIQPNLDPWEKWAGGNLNNLTDLYFSLSSQAVSNGAKLIVWPETALPVFLMDGSYNNIIDSIYSFLKKNNVDLLTGMPDVRYYLKGSKMPSDAIKIGQGSYSYTMYNGVLLFSHDSWQIQRYGKMKLVPFGERVPFVDTFPFLGDIIKWGVGISGWNIGKDTINFIIPFKSSAVGQNNILTRDTVRINALVCYESIYPYFVAEFVKRGADIIAVVTNDSWYGKSSGPYQHEDIAILRAVENRR
jgi:apolipoprotein N-acyltransferase